MSGMRNRLANAYGTVDMGIVWDVLEIEFSSNRTIPFLILQQTPHCLHSNPFSCSLDKCNIINTHREIFEKHLIVGVF